MPEGHTVHRLARTFADLFGGQVLVVLSPQGRFASGAALVSGRVLVASEAWGKQHFLGFGPPGTGLPASACLWLRIHLGLYGAWTFSTDGSTDVVHAIGAPRKRIGESDTTLPPTAPSGDGTWTVPAPRGAVRARLLGAHAVADLTGPTVCEVVTPAEKATVEARLGPDPIRPGGGRGSSEAAREAFMTRVRHSRVCIGRQLMDQSVIAGVGNIYRAEALFRAGLDPLRPGRDVPQAALGALWDDLVALLNDGAATGAIVTTHAEHRGATAPRDRIRLDRTGASAARHTPTRQNTDGAPGAVAPEDAFYVYHRDGLPCRVCGSPVLVTTLGGRSLYWCGSCQR